MAAAAEGPRHLADSTPVLADAKDRAWRTAVQNFSVDAAAAAGTGLYSALQDGDPFTGLFWSVLGMSVAKSVLLIAASYLMRLKVAPVTEGS